MKLKKYSINVILAIFFLLLKHPFSFSMEVEVPIVTQLQIFLKMIESERRLVSIKNKDIVIGVVFQQDFKTSNSTKKNIFNFSNNANVVIGGNKVRFVPIQLTSADVTASIEEINKQYGLNILIITQLRAINYRQIAQFASNNSILTYATNSDVMQNNKFSITVGYKGNNPQPWVNTKSLQSEGYSLPAQVLRLTKTIE